MDSVVIVALPSVDDKVYRISSEQVPHLTLLYLDATIINENLQAVVQHVQHAASLLHPFGLTVDYRGTLGSDDADVLFFEKTQWNIGDISDFRHSLLLNDTIKRAYDSADQYPEWTPHLTLGYPATPAHKDDDEYPGLRHVHFDQIAVWTGDYEGPEFRLKYESHSMEVAMGTIENGAAAAEAVLAHHGVKGMKWGVRNDNGHEGERVKTKKLEKLDKKWEKENTGTKAFMKAHNEAAGKMNDGEIDRINNKPEHSKAADEGKFNDWDNPTPELKAYWKDMDDTFNKHFNDAALKLGSNPSGTKRYEIQVDAEGNAYAQLTDIKHAEVGTVDVRYKISKNSEGQITKYTPEEAELKHYGVKGMRWGYTTKDGHTVSTGSTEKESRLVRGSKDVTVTQRKAGTYVKAKGGQRHKAADDAVRTQAARQIAKKSTTDALSTKELKTAIERMRLEQEFAKLDKKVSRKGGNFITKFLQTPEGKATAEDLLKRATAAAEAAA